MSSTVSTAKPPTRQLYRPIYAHDITDLSALDDELRRSALARTIARDIREVGERDSIFGVYGSWGAGKSYLISEVIAELFRGNVGAETKIIVAYFVPWRYELSGTLAPGLIRTLEHIESQFPASEHKSVNENPRLKNPTNYQAIARQLLPVVSGMLQLGAAFTPVGQALGPAIQNTTSGLRRLMGGDKDGIIGDVDQVQALMGRLVDAIIRSAREGEGPDRKRKGLPETKWRLVIAVDDLDRCSPHNMVQMFEWMKVHLRANNCTYLVALDHEAAARAIRGHYRDYLSDTQDVAYGFRYLEKLVDSEYELELAAHVEEMAIRQVFRSASVSRVSEVTSDWIGGDFPGVRFMDLLLGMRSLRIPRTMLKIVEKYFRALDVLLSDAATPLRNELPDGYPFWVLFLTAMYFRLEPTILGEFIEGRGDIFTLMSGRPLAESDSREVHEPLLEFYTFAEEFGRSVGASLRTPRPNTLSDLAIIVREVTLPTNDMRHRGP